MGARYKVREVTLHEPAPGADLGASSNYIGEITQWSEAGNGFKARSIRLELVGPEVETCVAKGLYGIRSQIETQPKGKQENIPAPSLG
jgi:hypothetical protein